MTHKHLIEQLIKHHEGEMGTMLGDALRAAATALECADIDLNASIAREEQLKILLSHARRKAGRYEHKARCLRAAL